MNTFVYLTFLLCKELIIFFRLTFGSPELTALTSSNHAIHLFLELRKKDPPTDSAASNPQTRLGICRAISSSGFFHNFGLIPMNVEKLRRDQYYSRYSKILYSFNDTREDYEYTNPYKLLEFELDDLFYIKEHVFLCPLKDKYEDKRIVPHYVSKEYNVGPFEEAYMPGRFILTVIFPQYVNTYHVYLAEEPAIARSELDFNVELHYLSMRKYAQPVEDDNIDPLCKYVEKPPYNPDNQHYRFCAAVAASSYFKEKIKYPDREPPESCELRKISFRTEPAKKEAAETLYFERMAPCFYRPVDLYERSGFFYISRGYISHQLLVYLPDLSDGEIYLENLSMNVSIADELNSFEFIEY